MTGAGASLLPSFTIRSTLRETAGATRAPVKAARKVDQRPITVAVTAPTSSKPCLSIASETWPKSP